MLLRSLDEALAESGIFDQQAQNPDSASASSRLPRIRTHMFSIGLMSGTSMDGIDAALLATDGCADIKELAHCSLSYDPEVKILLKAAEYAVKKYHGDLGQTEKNFLEALEEYLALELKLEHAVINQQLERLTAYLQKKLPLSSLNFDSIITLSTLLHGEAVQLLLQQTGYQADEIAVVGCHGQALYHQPQRKLSIIVNDGQALANQIHIKVVNDFRSKDIAAGGQGAPFAPLYHQALAVRDGKFPLAVVNCGGISNITLIFGAGTEEVFGYDAGPGNGLIDRLIKRRTQGREHMDKDGHYGLQGLVHKKVLQTLREKAVQKDGKNFLDLLPPKSLDIGDLILIPELESLDLPDACATLEAFTADCIVNSLALIKTNFAAPSTWILAGGGWHNPVILRELKARLKAIIGEELQILTADEAGWNSQALEAQIFAYFAVRSLQNLPLSVPHTTGVPYPCTGGQVYLPKSVVFSK